MFARGAPPRPPAMPPGRPMPWPPPPWLGFGCAPPAGAALGAPGRKLPDGPLGRTGCITQVFMFDFLGYIDMDVHVLTLAHHIKGLFVHL